MNTPRPKPGAAGRSARRPRRSAASRSGRRRSSRCWSTPTAVRERGPADRRLLPLERRLRVHHPAAARPGRAVLPGQRRRAQAPRPSARTDVDPGERFYYEVRNKVWMFTRSTRPGTVRRRLLYGGSTLRRWVRTVAASPRPADACGAALRRGLRRRRAHRRRGRTAAVLGRRGPGRGRRPSEPFSLLMPLWAGDDPDFLRPAWSQHGGRPDPAPRRGGAWCRTGRSATRWRDASPSWSRPARCRCSTLVLEHNVGLGPALDRGLAACALRRGGPDGRRRRRRCRTGSRCSCRSSRRAPTSSARRCWSSCDDVDEVVGGAHPADRPATGSARRARFRDPFNHPTVVYRRQAVQAAGGYQDLALMEDYLLFARMLAAGAEPANVAEPLVYYRIGAGAYARRGGLRRCCARRSRCSARFRELGHHHPRASSSATSPCAGGYRLVPTPAAPAGVPAADRAPRLRPTADRPITRLRTRPRPLARPAAGRLTA